MTTPSGPPTLDPAAAGTALRDADALEARARRASGWYARYMLVFAAGFGALTLLLGLGPDEPRDAITWVLVLVTAWFCFMTGMLVWALRRPVRDDPRWQTYVPGWVGTAVLYALALVLGISADLPAWGWVAAAVVVPLPLVLAAARLQRSRR